MKVGTVVLVIGALAVINFLVMGLAFVRPASAPSNRRGGGRVELPDAADPPFESDGQEVASADDAQLPPDVPLSKHFRELPDPLARGGPQQQLRGSGLSGDGGTRHHRHRHHRGPSSGNHHAPTSSSAPAAPIDNRAGPDSEHPDGPPVVEPPQRHHSRTTFFNVNRPDDMRPAVLQPATIGLCPEVNRSYVVFHVVGDWGGPGKEPQRAVATAMAQAAERGLSALLPSGAHYATRTTVSTKYGQVRVAPGTSHEYREDELNTTVVRTDFIDSFRCVVGLKRVPHAPTVKPEAIELPQVQSSIDFVVSTGDNMYEDGVADEFDPKFKRNFEHVYTQPALQRRWYMALGNHDHGAHGVMRDVRGQLRYTARSRKWFMPSTYYHQPIDVVDDACSQSGNSSHSREIRPASFRIDLIVLDIYDISPFMTKISAGQLDWLNKTLAACADSRWRVVVGHRPIYSAGSKHGSSPYMQKHVLELLTQHKVVAYLSGDDHEMQVLEAGNVTMVVSGGGARAKNDLKAGGIRETLFQTGTHGFATVAVTRDEFAVSIINGRGKAVYRTVRLHPDAASRGSR